MTMIELMVGIAIVAILFSFAAPSFSTWIQNTQIRTAAEALQNGLQLARGEAVRRNTQISFQLMTTLDNSCALSTSGPNWVVSQPVSLPNAVGACAAAPLDPPNLPTAPDPSNPYIIQTRSGTEGSKNAVVAASQGTVVFNGLGRVTPVPAGNVSIDITNPIGGACATASGPMRCLRVIVSPGGQVRMCDPMFPSTDPQGC